MAKLHRYGTAISSVLIALSAGSATGQQSTPATTAVQTSRYLTAVDGTRIAVSIFRPSRDGRVDDRPMPVIVTQDRGQESSERVATARRYFLDRGYVIVAQDRRGTGASFGVQNGFVNAFDAQDAKTVIEWAGAQPFSTGKVVTMGCSNQGAWQYLVATLKPRHLVAIAPACASPQFFDHGVMTNGVPVFPGADTKPFDGKCRPDAVPARQAAAVRPVDEDPRGTMLKAAQQSRGCNAPMLGQYWRTMTRDALSPVTGIRPGLDDSAITAWQAVRDSGVAILQIGGWYDAAVLGQMQGQALWGGKLIMGPWTHGNTPPRGATIPNATIDLLGETARWFDHYAKGVANGAERAGVYYYTTNAPAGREWSWATRWPSVTDKTTPFFLTPSGLSPKAPARSGAQAIYPQQPVSWFDGAYEPLSHFWIGDMAPTDARMLGHDSAALTADLRITGTPTARLWVSADTPDVNVRAVLEDVAADGRSTYVTDGVLRASWRRTSPAPFPNSIQHWKPGYDADLQPLKPGQAAELVFELYPTSYIFKRGHRIRLSIATTIGKAFQEPPLAGGKAPTLTVLRDAAHASRLDLPVVRALSNNPPPPGGGGAEGDG